MAPTAALPAPETNGISLAGGLDRGWAPPFRSAERDQEYAALTVHWSPAPTATLRLHYDVLTARWPDGTENGGSGDIRLGAAGRVWDGAPHPALPEVWVDWSAKLPNASDAAQSNAAVTTEDAREYGLGTDETDSTVGGGLRWVLDPGVPVTVMATGALLIMGNPLMFANQDDATQLGLLVETALGPVAPFIRGEARLPSPRNVGDIKAIGGAEWRSKQGLLAGAEARVGLTPAAADWGAAAWFGYAWGCPSCEDD